MPVLRSPHDGALRGTISVGGREMLVRMEVDQLNQPGTSDLQQGRHLLWCEPELAGMLEGQRDLVKLRMGQSSRPGDLVVSDLEEILERMEGRKARQDLDVLPISFYQYVVKEIESVGWECVSEASEDLRQVTLYAKDAKGRKHHITAMLPPDFPHHGPKYSAQLPEPFDATLTTGADAFDPLVKDTFFFPKVLRKFKSRLERYQGVWEVLEDLDENTWVLDPVAPTRAILFRRVALGKHSSLQITISVESPRGVCECQFLGSEAVVGPLRDKFNQGLRKWDNTLLVRENLETILEVRFPLNQQNSCSASSTCPTLHESALVECGVCYSFRLPLESARQDDTSEPKRVAQSQLPDCVCENPKCARAFHPNCLQEWLQALPSTRHTFDTIFGSCPYCSESISVRRV